MSQQTEENGELTRDGIQLLPQCLCLNLTNGGVVIYRQNDSLKLTGLRLPFNHLTGSIPPELGNLQNLWDWVPTN